jgi:hypothetical protein
MKKIILGAWLAVILGVISVLFWYSDWQYRLPTPVPEGYKAVASGIKINFQGDMKRENGKPLFLHFFNPICPCSKFNFQHFKSLVNKYEDEVNFAIVVMSNKKYTTEEIQDRYGISIPVFFDTAIAAACGVYSTPQAAIIDKDDHLYYRGNYNSTRYCTDKKTEYARIALDALLSNNQIEFAPAALTAYGCTLPKCSK